MIELKKEYMEILQRILTPIIFEGLLDMYDKAKEVTKDKEHILQSFQFCLKKISSWDSKIINDELNRIIHSTQTNYPWFIQLIQTIFKLNMLIDNMEPSEMLKNQVNLGKFIHFIYIESARFFWMDPFLFYHEYSSLEIKKNHLDIMNYIDKSIEHAIRRLLPMGIILEKFLGEMTVNNKSIDITNLYDMPLLLDLPLKKEPIIMTGGTNITNKLEQYIPNNIDQHIPNNIDQHIPNNIVNKLDQYIPNNIVNKLDQHIPNNIVNKLDQYIPITNMNGGDNNDSLDNKLNNEILNIINKNKILTETNENNNFTVNNHSNHSSIMHNTQNTNDKSSSTLKRIIRESIKNANHTKTNTHTATLNSEVKNKILKELDSDVILHNNNNFQDVFSNSEIKTNNNNINQNKSKDKFFNNYLNI